MEIPEQISGRPVGNRGVHLHPGGMHNYWMQRADYWCKLLVDMNMSWCVALSGSDNVLISGAAEALLDAGVIPIVRFAYQFPAHFTEMAATEALVSLYSRYGAPCIIQFANEPFDPREWRNEDVPRYEEAWSIIADRWNEAAQIITQRGAIAGFPDGPCYPDNPFLRIRGTEYLWHEGKAVYLTHNYGKGRPVTYPYDAITRCGIALSWQSYCEQLDDFQDDPNWNEGLYVLELMNQQRTAWRDPTRTIMQDDTCWLGWLKTLQWGREAFGINVQMAMTEGGWVPRDRAGSNPTDIRWPYTTPIMVAKKTLAMYRYPSPLFAICPWLLADREMAGGGDVGWPMDAWVTWVFEDKYGLEKPVVQALKDAPV